MINKLPNKFKRSKTGSRYIVLPLLCLLCSCVKGDGLEPLPTERTVLIYLAGDNDLSPSLSAVVENIRNGWSYTGNNCLIYIDPTNGLPQLLRLRGGCTSYPVPTIETVATYPEENSASAEVLSRVIAKVQADYPAPSYGLIFASHASGWLPIGSLANPSRSVRSIGSDSNPTIVGGEPQEMDLADFARAIPDSAFDFIIFEACLMAGVEVAYELKGKTNYILASSAELLAPGFVPIYAKSQCYLFDTRLTTEQALTAFATDYYNYINTQSGAYRSTTLSIIKTGELDRLTALLKGVTLAGASLSNTQHFDRPGSYGEAVVSPRYFDLLHALQQVLSPSIYQQVDAQIEKVVVNKVSTPTILMGYNGFEVKHHSGMTIYLEQPQFPNLNTAYQNTSWYKATHEQPNF